MHQKQSICESRRPATREAEREGKPPLPMLPSVLMFANWSFVTQIGAGEVQRRNSRPATTHGFISGGPPALMCTTSSAHAALIQEVTSAGWEGLPNTAGLWEKRSVLATTIEQKEPDTRMLKWPNIHIHAKITHHTQIVAALKIKLPTEFTLHFIYGGQPDAVVVTVPQIISSLICWPLNSFIWSS